MNCVHFNLCITDTCDSTEGMGGRIFMAKTPLLGHKNSKMSLKKLYIIIVKWSALLLTTDKNQGHARISEIYEIYNN